MVIHYYHTMIIHYYHTMIILYLDTMILFTSSSCSPRPLTSSRPSLTTPFDLCRFLNVSVQVDLLSSMHVDATKRMTEHLRELMDSSRTNFMLYVCLMSVTFIGLVYSIVASLRVSVLRRHFASG